MVNITQYMNSEELIDLLTGNSSLYLPWMHEKKEFTSMYDNGMFAIEEISTLDKKEEERLLYRRTVNDDSKIRSLKTYGENHSPIISLKAYTVVNISLYSLLIKIIMTQNEVNVGYDEGLEPCEVSIGISVTRGLSESFPGYSVVSNSLPQWLHETSRGA